MRTKENGEEGMTGLANQQPVPLPRVKTRGKEGKRKEREARVGKIRKGMGKEVNEGEVRDAGKGKR